jgi:nucleotide-binding universal stress UspA family protein
MGSPDLLRRVILPVATSDSARETCKAALPYIANANGEVIAVHVVETNPGGIDTAPPSALKEVGEQTLSVVEARCKEYSVPVQTELRYGPKVNEEVFDIARSKGATAVGFVPRIGSRLEKFLSGDNALSMITQNDVPVVVFPRVSPLTDGGAETKKAR